MRGDTRTRSKAHEATRASPSSFPLIEAKLSIPPAREGVIPRHRLLTRITNASDDRSIVTVIAPPGYGKTTLMAQWAEMDGRPVVWLTVDERDNDPSVLLTYLAAGLDRVRPIDRAVLRSLTSPAGNALWAVPRLVGAIQACDPKPLILLDDAHLLTEAASLDALTELAAELPPGSHLVIGGRTDIGLPLPVLRARGRLLEIGRNDLSLRDEETAALLHAAEPGMPLDTVHDIVQRTEGWPAAAYLAALSFASDTDAYRAEAFSGADRFVSDYVWSEILERISTKDLRFLTRTSVIDRMSGPICDAVTRTKGSADTLRRLERSSLLLVPLDRRREWYRCHPLLRDVLRAELERREPDRVAELRRRAAAWYERDGALDAAVELYLAAGDDDRAVELITLITQPLYRVGRAATLERWIAQLEARGAIEDHPPLAALVAWLRAFTGDALGTERWAAIAAQSPTDRQMHDGSPSIASWITLLNGLRCPDGVGRMRRNAELAVAEIPPTSFFFPVALTILGVASRLSEGADGEARFTQAIEVAQAIGSHPAGCIASGLLASSMTSRGDWAHAEATLDRARAMIDEGGLEDYWTSALVYALGARMALHRGDPPSAQADLIRAQRLRPALTHAIPWNAVLVRLEMIRAHLALADAAGARTLLREAEDLLRRCPDLGTLNAEVEEVRRLVQAMPSGIAGASSLTAAEIRLLPYLHTYMSFRDIAQRLFVSPNTVKTQAVSLYRKLGVSSRSEAMRRAEELGLIER